MEDPGAAAPQSLRCSQHLDELCALLVTISGQDPESTRVNDRYISESSLKQVILRHRSHRWEDNSAHLNNHNILYFLCKPQTISFFLALLFLGFVNTLHSNQKVTYRGQPKNTNSMFCCSINSFQLWATQFPKEPSSDNNPFHEE